jgi:hypothetical protein
MLEELKEEACPKLGLDGQPGEEPDHIGCSLD